MHIIYTIILFKVQVEQMGDLRTSQTKMSDNKLQSVLR